MMESIPKAAGLTPPLKLAWQNSTSLRVAVAGNGRLYGITAEGSLVAMNGATGELIWAGRETYLTGRLAISGSDLFAYVASKGLFRIHDNGNGGVEQMLISFGASTGTNLSTPVIQGTVLFMAVNQSLVATDPTRGLLAAQALPDVQPYGIVAVGSSDVLLMNGQGTPFRYRISGGQFELVWAGQVADPSVGQRERPTVITGSRLLVGINETVVAYDLQSGRILWRAPAVASVALAQSGATTLAVGVGLRLAAINTTTGEVNWRLGYLIDQSIQANTGLAVADGFLFAGSSLRSNPDLSLLAAFRVSDGAFTWLSRNPQAEWAGGMPIVDNGRIYAVGGPKTGAYVPLEHAVPFGPDQVSVSPRLLRGARSRFGSGQITVNLTENARVTIAAFREREGLGSPIVNGASWGRGSQQVPWSPGATNCFSDANQFGYLQLGVRTQSGEDYVQSVFVPVNTLPDILSHWAGAAIEVMLYNGLVNGYPDMTFKPDNLLTRAESCAIIAKTLGLDGPSPGFQTKFTDLTGHWARSAIMALEERNIVGGFAEPDGTFTFRPDLNMTRGQEARILVVAFNIPAAPASFHSKFKDISTHWAKNEIMALENAGYVNGFAEPDGTFTYRPDQNLTRAEMCAVVVRIKRLTR